MTYLKKDLPPKKELKQYFNLNESTQFTVKAIEYFKDCISMNVTPKENVIFPSFYQKISCIDFQHNAYIIDIPKEHFGHVIKNFKVNFEYIKSIAK